MHTKLLSDIDKFLAETGMAPGYFGWCAAKNWRLVERLRNGFTPKGKPVRIWPETEQEIRAYMIAERRKRGPASKQEKAA